MSVKEDVDALVEAATTLRVRLQAERQTLIDRLLELDGQIGRLPGGEQVERPTSLDEWRQRRRQLLAHEVGRPGQPINSRDVIHATAIFYGLTVAQLKGPERFASVAKGRHVAMYLCRKLTGESFPELGAAFGNRDHTTVIAGVRGIEERIATDAELKAEVDALEPPIRAAQEARKTADQRIEDSAK